MNPAFFVLPRFLNRLTSARSEPENENKSKDKGHLLEEKKNVLAFHNPPPSSCMNVFSCLWANPTSPGDLQQLGWGQTQAWGAGGSWQQHRGGTDVYPHPCTAWK